MRLSIVADGEAVLDERVEAIEGRDPGLVQLGLETYVEGVPLEEVKAVGARAKVAAVPIRRRSTSSPASWDMPGEGIAFKATAGLHHAVRTGRPFGRRGGARPSP